MKHKLDRPKGRYVNVAGTASEIAKYYKIKPVFTSDDQCAFSSTFLGLLAQQTVARYEQSGDADLQEKHVPHQDIKAKSKKYPDVDVRGIRYEVFKYAKQLWKDRTDLLSPVLATHDTYLKLYQLSNPKLNYDILYVDEVQDSNQVMLDIVLKQNCKTILVGDSYQSIYQFRGAVNALQRIAAPTSHLSQSFRFGQEVADVANNIILPKTKIKGSDKQTDVDYAENIDIEELPEGSCLLFRTNMGLMLTAIDLISKGIFVDTPRSVSGAKSAISSALALKKGDMKNVKHTSLIPFSSWSEFKDGCKDDPELEAVYNLTKGSEQDLKAKLEMLNKNDPTEATYTLRTAHGSKGLEWDTVMVMNDFKTDPETYLNNQQEANLLYVAHTRAMKKLYKHSVVDAIGLPISDLSSSEPRADMANYMLEQQIEQEANNWW
jgi:superfamily I DNA/RNA helicase